MAAAAILAHRNPLVRSGARPELPLVPRLPLRAASRVVVASRRPAPPHAAPSAELPDTPSAPAAARPPPGDARQRNEAALEAVLAAFYSAKAAGTLEEGEEDEEYEGEASRDTLSASLACTPHPEPSLAVHMSMVMNGSRPFAAGTPGPRARLATAHVLLSTISCRRALTGSTGVRRRPRFPTLPAPAQQPIALLFSLQGPSPRPWPVHHFALHLHRPQPSRQRPPKQLATGALQTPQPWSRKPALRRPSSAERQPLQTPPTAPRRRRDAGQADRARTPPTRPLCHRQQRRQPTPRPRPASHARAGRRGHLTRTTARSSAPCTKGAGGRPFRPGLPALQGRRCGAPATHDGGCAPWICSPLSRPPCTMCQPLWLRACASSLPPPYGSRATRP
jgi:hypothetical protein